MSTVLRPPAAPPGARPMFVRERRRWPRRVAIVTVILLALALAGSAVWFANLEPLERGSTGFAVTDPSLHASARSVDALGVTGTVTEIPAVPGMSFTYRFSLRNDGPIPIRIDGVGTPAAGDVLTRQVVAVATDPYARTKPAFVPFHPFSLAAGAEAWIQMRVHLARDACLGVASGQTFLAFYDEDVRWSVLAIHRASTVDTGEEIRLVGTRATAANCSA